MFRLVGLAVGGGDGDGDDDLSLEDVEMSFFSICSIIDWSHCFFLLCFYSCALFS